MSSSAGSSASFGAGPSASSGFGASTGAASVLDAYTIARCRAIIAKGSKSFALASRLLPPESRDSAAVVYSWCRYADDAIDRAAIAEQPGALARLRAELADIYAGRPQTDIVLAAFQAVVQHYRIPQDYPAELLAGMEMDVVGTRYDSMQTLLLYCFRVASTVGLMMSHVMGVATDDALAYAAHMGIAMQLTNICRDVLEDWNMGRLYVPDELLAACGLPGLRAELGQPFPLSARAPMAEAVRRLLDEADRYYRSGDRGLVSLPWRCAVAVRAARLIYAAIGDRIAAMNHDVTAGRAIVPGKDKLALASRASLMAVAELPERAVGRLGDLRPAPAIPGRLVRFPDDIVSVGLG